jgi:hypothetical protein
MLPKPIYQTKANSPKAGKKIVPTKQHSKFHTSCQTYANSHKINQTRCNDNIIDALYQKSNSDKISVPLTTDPAVEKLQTGLGLVHRNHVACAVDAHEGEVAVSLDLTNLLVNVLIVDNLEGFKLLRSELLLARPLEGLGPGLVTEPVADEVSITGVDQDGDLLKETRH